MIQQYESHEALRSELILDNDGDLLAQRFDINSVLESELGLDWQRRMVDLVERRGVLSFRDASDPTSREENPTQKFGMVTLAGDVLIEEFPGLAELYSGTFANLMARTMSSDMEPFKLYEDPRLALEVYVQILPPNNSGIGEGEGDEAEYRLDAHTDGRYTAILAFAVPEDPEDGQLVVSNTPEAATVEEIDRDPIYISHRIGTLVCAPRLVDLPHYTQVLRGNTAQRVGRGIISINFPRVSEPTDAAERLHAHFSGM